METDVCENNIEWNDSSGNPECSENIQVRIIFLLLK